MQPAWFLTLIPGLPLLGALVVALMRNRWPEQRLARAASLFVTGALAATVAALITLVRLPDEGYRALGFSLWQWELAPGYRVALGLLGDSLSLWFAIVVTGVGLMIHIFSAAYMEGDSSYGRYFAQLNYFIFAMSLLVLSDNFLGTLLGWAQVGLASYLLIGFWNRRPSAQAAANKAFLINMGGEVGLILGLGLIFSTFGSFRFAEVFPQVAAAPQGTVTAIALLLLVAATAKSAQLPLHTWLPDAMEGPTPVSALIHAATMVTAGVYLVARAFPLYEASGVAMQAVALVGAASALYGALSALGQTDIKRVLAYSTMSQIGYMILSAGIGAYEAALFHFLTHAFFKALLFLAAGMVIHHLGGEQDIRKMGGLGARMPFAYGAFLVGTLALAGAPPLAGFFSKDEILVDLLVGGHSGYWVLGLAVAALTAFYMFRALALVFTGPTAEEARAAAGGRSKGKGHSRAAAGAAGSSSQCSVEPVDEDDMRMAGPVAVLMALSVAGGWIAVPGWTSLPSRFLGPVFNQFPGVARLTHAAATDPAAAKSLTLVVVLALTAAATGLALLLYGPRRGPGAKRVLPLLTEGFYLDRLYRATVPPAAHAVAALTSRVLEPGVVDGAVNGIAAVVRSAAEGTAELHGGYIRRYALSLVAGAIVVLLYFAWM